MIRKIIFIISMLFLIALLLGCGPEEKISGYVTAELKDNIIKNGEATQLTIKGINDGNKPIKAHFEFTTDKPEMVKLSYPSDLEFVLQPSEDTGNKILTVQGFTETIRTDYLIEVRLVDEAGNLIHATNKVLSVIK